CCVALGSLLVWERGPYWDDYGWARSARIPAALEPRVLSTLTSLGLTHLLATHELLARTLCALGGGLSALLLGWLAARALCSPLAGVAAAWLYATPLLAAEAALWLSTAGYLFGMALALLGLHAAWSALEQPGRFGTWTLVCCFAFLVALLFYEVYAPLVLLVPALGALRALREREPTARRALLARGLVVALAALVMAGGPIALLYLRSSEIVGARGGLDADPASVAAHAARFTAWLAAHTIASSGRQVLSESIGLGLYAVARARLGQILAVVTGLALLLAAVGWQARRREERGSRRELVLGCVVGVAWLLLTLVRGQEPTSRLLYVPLAGLAFAVAAALQLVATLLPRQLGERVALGIAALLALLGALGMAGQATAFAARSDLDHRQVAAVLRALPPDTLPADVYLLPINLEQRLFRQDDAISGTLTPLFDVRSLAEAELNAAYGRADVHVLTTDRRELLRYEYLNQHLWIEGEAVRLDHLIPFTYRD